MRIAEFKKLEERINNQNFNKGYKTINGVMFILSIFGHIASIFLAYFLVSKILATAMTNPVAVTISSLIMLVGLELLKRDMFDKFSIQQLKSGFNKEILPLVVASLMLVSTSFYLTITGAQEFASKEKLLEQNKVEVINTFNDSLTTVYNTKITEVDTEIKDAKSKIDAKDKEQTELEAIQPPTWSARSRIGDLKKEKDVLRADITKLESDKVNLKKELDDKIKAHEETISTDTEEKKQDNTSNSFMFVIISTIIEFLIIIGVYFNEYYKFRSYREFRNKIEKDPNYQKWLLYDKILSTIYPEDAKMNQKLPANKNIIDMCKVNDLTVLPKDVTDFLKVMSGIGIIKVSGSAKYLNKQRDFAFELLKKHFNIE